MSEAKHAPTPWALRAGSNGAWHIESTVIGFVLCGRNPWEHRAEMSLANGQFIVRAVNAHDDLVKALIEIAGLIEAGEVYGTEIHRIARAALAKAEGRTDG